MSVNKTPGGLGRVGCEAWDPRIKRHVCLNKGRKKRSRRRREQWRRRKRSGGDTVLKADESTGTWYKGKVTKKLKIIAKENWLRLSFFHYCVSSSFLCTVVFVRLEWRCVSSSSLLFVFHVLLTHIFFFSTQAAMNSKRIIFSHVNIISDVLRVSSSYCEISFTESNLDF